MTDPSLTVIASLACRMGRTTFNAVLAVDASRSILVTYECGTRFAALIDVAIDRKTQDSDVMERVLGIDADPSAEDVRTEVIELAVVPWLAGATVSAVQLSVGGIRPRRSNKPHSRR